MQMSLGTVSVEMLVDLCFGMMLRGPFTDRGLDRLEHVIETVLSFDEDIEDLLAKHEGESGEVCDACGRKVILPSPELLDANRRCRVVKRELLEFIPELRKIESIEQRDAIINGFTLRLMKIQLGASEASKEQMNQLFGESGSARVLSEMENFRRKLTGDGN